MNTALVEMKKFIKSEGQDAFLKEIRFRFYTTLKSLYWKAFIEGQSIDDSTIHLIDTASVALDSKLESLDSLVTLAKEFPSQRYLGFIASL